jgi:aspartyl-tRNA(Asn)/glutamyl-tRNA(Gln) amidotransferase subunit A
MCSAAIGTDGGGSIRLPGGAHGLIGFKPTHGLVSRHGMDHNSHSEISPLTRTVRDAALMLDAIAGHVPEDDMSWPGAPVGYAERLEEADVRGWRVGVPWKYVRSAPNEPEVMQAFESFLAKLESLGCEMVDVQVHGLAEARMANFLVLNAEAYQRHGKSLRQDWTLYGEITRVYLLQGAFLTAEDFLNASEVGRAVRSHLEADVLTQHVGGSGVRAIAMPTSPFVTAERSRRPGEHSRGINACFTAPFNITGHPSVSVPAGISASTGLPIGAMLTAALHDDLGLLQLAHAHERATEWHTLHPEV